jgi:5-hydroxyisourate hydrolase-like protein (transthyretin family)
MGIVEKEYHWISFRFLVYHKQMFELSGWKAGLSGVSIVISQQAEDGKFYAHAKITTDKDGRASWYKGGQGIEQSGTYNFRYTKEEYEETESQAYYQQDTEHHIEQALTQAHYEEKKQEEEQLKLAWNAQSEIEKIANSFITALAIIMVFKVLQGFSMERINPVA